MQFERVAVQTGRKFIGIERDPGRFIQARARITRELAQGVPGALPEEG